MSTRGVVRWSELTEVCITYVAEGELQVQNMMIGATELLAETLKCRGNH
jgi:hypothetical protein